MPATNTGNPQRFTQALKDQIKSIPIQTLRKLVTDTKSHSKVELAKALFSANPIKLVNLASYWAAHKERSFYLLKQKPTVTIQLTGARITALKGRKVRDTSQDFIAECAEASVDTERNEAYLQIKMHSPKRKVRGEDAETLEPREYELRRGLHAYVIIHLADKVFECRSKRASKTEYVKMALGQFLFDDTGALDVIVLTQEKQRQLDSDLRIKRVVITGLQLSGTEEITLKGQDVQGTLDFLNTRHSLNLENMGGQVSKGRSELTNRPMKFFPDGKISVEKSIEDPYAIVRGLV